MKIFGDNVLSLYICTQTIKGFYVYLLSSFYIGVRSFVKSTGSSFFSSAVCLFPRDSPDLGIFSVYISFLISRVRPVHSFFEKKSILENLLLI